MYLDQWGPIAWELFHYITYTFKQELRDYYIIYYKTLYSIIPCPNCSNDIKEILNKDENLPTLHLYSKDAMIKWFIKIHNIVNIKTNNSNRFDIKMANDKYMKGDNITIDNERIYKFLELSYKSKINENNPDFIRNIIALVHIYPSSINMSNITPILSLRKIDNFKDIKWMEILKNAILNPQLKETSIIKYNNNQFNTYLKKVVLEDKKNCINENRIQMLGNSMLLILNNNKTMNIVYTYKVIETTDILITIKGQSFGGDINVIVKYNNYKKIFSLNDNIIIRDTNIKEGTKIVILLQSYDNKSGNKHIIEHIDIT